MFRGINIFTTTTTRTRKILADVGRAGLLIACLWMGWWYVWWAGATWDLFTLRSMATIQPVSASELLRAIGENWFAPSVKWLLSVSFIHKLSWKLYNPMKVVHLFTTEILRLHSILCGLIVEVLRPANIWDHIRILEHCALMVTLQCCPTGWPGCKHHDLTGWLSVRIMWLSGILDGGTGGLAYQCGRTIN